MAWCVQSSFQPLVVWPCPPQPVLNHACAWTLFKQDVFTEYVWGDGSSDAGGDASASPLSMRIRGEARPAKKKGGRSPPRNVTLLVYVGTAAGQLSILTGRKGAEEGAGTLSRVRTCTAQPRARWALGGLLQLESALCACAMRYLYVFDPQGIEGDDVVLYGQGTAIGDWAAVIHPGEWHSARNPPAAPIGD